MNTILKRVKTFPKYDLQILRWKHKDTHWAAKSKHKPSTDRALKYFDEFYEQVFHSNWQPIRKALVSQQKYVAVVNNYSDADEICARLENRGAFNMRKSLEFQREVLSEKKQHKSRDDRLKQIWKADVEKVKDDEGELKKPSVSVSLEKSLKDAEIDTSRIIDSGNSSSVLYEYIPATKIKGREDFISEEPVHFKPVRDFPVNVQKEQELHFPEFLNVYLYEQENYTQFPKPKKGSTNVYDYYLMDGGSIFPVLALDLQPGLSMLDMCSAPGGKSYVALQSLYLENLVCNDVSVSRTNRIFGVFKEYLYDLNERWLKPGKLTITAQDARFINGDGFDRILVDVPCTTDRHSVKEDDNNIFRPDRVKERLKLPELQCEILCNALKLVKPGGIVVYSTCSLSPIQNDGVVHMALKKLWEETKIEVVVKDLNPALQQSKHIFNFASPKLSKYGSLILPQTVHNFGPTYFCKIERVQ